MTPEPPQLVEIPPWGKQAVRALGIHELAGKIDEPWIVDALARVGFAGAHDEVAWCSAGLNKCFELAGFKGSQSAAARSWLQWGLPLTTLRPWCVLVWERHDPNNPSAAHVNLFIADLGTHLVGLGCNQQNAVGVDARPRSRLLGARWPIGVP